jgi:hypothetical protein
METIHGSFGNIDRPNFPGSFGKSSKKIHGIFGKIPKLSIIG